MSSIIEQFILLPVMPPGNLAYHAILAFTVFGALVGALQNRPVLPPSAGRRMTVGLSAILVLLLAQFIVTGLAWQGVISAEGLMPVLDRLIGLLSLLIIVWLWTYPSLNRLVDALAVLLGLVLVALAAYTLVWWLAQQPVENAIYFNGSAADQIGGWLALGLVFLGIFLLLVRRPPGMGFGLAMLVGLAAGYLLHRVVSPLDNDFAGAVRLAELAFYPLLLVLPQRFPVTQDELPPTPAAVMLDADRPVFNQDARAQQALVDLYRAGSPRQFYQELASTLARLMKADICLLALPQLNERYLIFPGGYNLITDSKVEGFSLEQRKIPTLVNALSSGQPLNLPIEAAEAELGNLANALKVEQAGALLAAPVTDPKEGPLLGIVLLTPYSNRMWSEADQQYLAEAALSLAPAILRLQRENRIQEQLEQTRLRMEALDSEATQAVSENSQLISRLEALQNELSTEKQRSTSLAALVSAHTSQQELPPPQPSGLVLNGQLQQEADPEYEQMQSDLRLVLEELATLRQSLAQADQTILELRSQDSSDTEASDREVIISIAQELRQPMSSIIGYTDLLLGESVGLLGAMQRKFLERVKASSERMGGLLEELIQVSSLNGGEMNLNPVMVDLNTVIDDAVSSLIAQLSEKNITLRVDLPDELPPIQADLEALQQILSNLLSNAAKATPADGQISLRARIEAKEHEPSFLLLQVADQGGGIPSADLPRVFSRLYRADNVLVQGIGDTGIGLALVKTLVEAHHGRIWVDTEAERGSTFSVLLPLTVTTVGEASGAAAG